jgi:hypothetical protein
MEGRNGEIAPAVKGRGLTGIQSDQKATGFNDKLTKVERKPRVEVKGQHKHGAS